MGCFHGALCHAGIEFPCRGCINAGNVMLAGSFTNRERGALPNSNQVGVTLHPGSGNALVYRRNR